MSSHIYSFYSTAQNGKVKYSFIVFLILFIFSFSLNGQSPKIKFKHITSEEGLSQSHGMCILQDSEGFMWFGTHDGLNKWDGYKMTVYRNNPKDSTSLSNNDIVSLFEDRDNNLWICTINGLNLFDRKKESFKSFKHDPSNDKSISSSNVRSVYEDKDGDLWVGTNGGGLNKFDKKETFTRFNSDEIGSNTFICFYEDKKDNLWIGTGNGLRHYDKKTNVFTSYRRIESDQNSLSGEFINAILEDHLGNLWIATQDGGLNLFDRSSKTFKHFLNHPNDPSSLGNNNLYCLIEDKSGNLWIGTENGGLNLLDRKTNSFIHYTQDKNDPGSISNNTVSALYEDNSGNIWVGMHRGGINFFSTKPENFKHYKAEIYPNSISNNNIKPIYENKNGNIWIGTDGGGLNFYDRNKNTFQHFKHDPQNSRSIGSDAVLGIAEDHAGKLWVGTWGGGLNSFDHSTGTFKRYYHDPKDINTISSNNVWTLYKDKKGNLWIGSFGGGLDLLDSKTGKITRISAGPDGQEALTSKNIFVINEDKEGNIWIGTQSGLNRYNPITNRFTQFLADEKKNTAISSNYINAIFNDSKGRLWIGTQKGLNLFNPQNETFSLAGEKEGLGIIAIQGILEDEKGNFWISTLKGLAKFNPDIKSFQNFTIADGLQGNEFSQNSTLKTKSGEMIFGGLKGFNLFHPDSLKNNPFVPPVYITGFQIFNKNLEIGGKNSPLTHSISQTKDITLSYKQSVFSFEFSALNYTAAENNEYAYMLEGFDTEWNYVGHQRKATYTNIDAGTYTFKVKASNNDGVWNEEGASIKLTITPPWYQTWWFKVLLLVAISATIVSIFYLRVASIKQQNRLLEKEVKKRTHELTDLNSFLLERNEEIKLQNEKLEEYNQKVLSQSDKILNQQKHILEQNQVLENTIKELRKSNQTKDKFFSILAHDLKNPVAALSGIAESLNFTLPKLSQKEVQGYIKDIHLASQGVYNLLINLLNWSKTQSKRLEHFPSVFNINDLVRNNALLLQQQLHNKELKLTIDINSSHFAYADYNMIDAIVRNLLNNSIKFTYSGGSIKMESQEADEEIIISLTDDGVGMSEEQLETLFNVEKNYNTSGTDGETGTGLGMIIIKEFIHANGGKISVSSEKDKGSTFKISLPKAETPEETVKGEKAWESAVEQLIEPGEDFSMEKTIKLKGKKLLIVDDNKEVRSHLKLMLSETFEVFEAKDGKEGLEIAIKNQPFTIITDMIMPVMNGIEFCKEIKKNTSTSHIPIILLTSQVNEESQISGYGAGAEIYLNKPVKKRLLINVFLNFIHNQEIMREKMMGSTNFLPEEVQFNKAEEEFFNGVIEVILENLSDPYFDFKIICNQMNISRTVLYTKIKTITGQGVHEFIKGIRLKKSLKLLAEGKWNISQIALEVGFNSHSYFNKCFIKQYGMPPKDYIKKTKKTSANS
ncbi:MAG TPA: two-component regulator propeller domain-containing protein [Cytophagales bacterium]|nr:two-component regulator propeller domain-containing protein [Cytophagales bacterium]